MRLLAGKDKWMSESREGDKDKIVLMLSYRDVLQYNYVQTHRKTTADVFSFTNNKFQSEFFALIRCDSIILSSMFVEEDKEQ